MSLAGEGDGSAAAVSVVAERVSVPVVSVVAAVVIFAPLRVKMKSPSSSPELRMCVYLGIWSELPATWRRTES
jgi:hypothetical protein